MPEFTVYNTATGEVRCTGTMALTEWCLAQAGEGESVYLGSAPLGTYIKDGAPAQQPPRPSDAHVWTAGGWSDPRSVDQKKAALQDLVTARRWDIETGGITLPGGIRVLTGTADQDRITSVVVNATAAGISELDFKADSGWARLSIEDLQGIARGIALHVQACFSAERAHHDAVDLLTTDAQIDAYDVSAGWPATAPEQE